MDTAKLTPEERNAFTALVRSPGWAILMEKLIIPQVQLATQFLDRPAAEQSGKADWLRGIKASYMNLVDVLYHVAGIESPFTRHALGLLTTFRHEGSQHEVDSSIMHFEGRNGYAVCGQNEGIRQTVIDVSRVSCLACKKMILQGNMPRAHSGFPV